MNKHKLFALLLAALLLSPGCVSEKIKDHTHDPENTEVSRSEFYFKDGLPDIGEYKTQKNVILDGAYDLNFVPSDSYGTLLPYAGKMYDYKNETGNDYSAMMFGGLSYAKYGFCTSDGKIVKMPLYDHITVQSTGNDTYYSASHDTADTDVGDDYYESISTESYIIPHDGRWHIDCFRDFNGEGNWLDRVFDDGEFTVSEYHSGNNPDSAQTGITYYNKDGKATSAIKKYDFVGEFVNGIAVAANYGADGPVYVYIDKNGNELFGSYSYAATFSDDMTAAVTVADGKSGIIDSDGNFVLQPEYESVSKGDGSYCDFEYFQGTKSDGKRYIFDSKGKLIKTVDYDNYITIYGSSDNAVYSYYDVTAEKQVFKRMSDDSEIVCRENGLSPNTVSNVKGYLFCVDTDNTAYMIDYDGNTYAKLDNFEDTVYTDVTGDKMLYQMTLDEESDGNNEEYSLYGSYKQKFTVYDIKNKSVIADFDGYAWAEFCDENQRYVKFELIDGSDSLYDTEKKEFVFENCRIIYCYNACGKTYFSVLTDTKTSLYGEDMNLIMSMPVDKTV